jgi:hypothetical protein
MMHVMLQCMCSPLNCIPDENDADAFNKARRLLVF